MNWFDQSIIHFFNSYAHRWWIVDATLVEISNSNLLDGAILMAMFWWAWIAYGKKDPAKREVLTASLALCVLAVVLARVLALALPYRERPIRNPLLHFTYPFTANPNSLIHWSSFPSDHAVLTFCIATGLWMVSRRLGTVALIYSLFTNVPRIYSGAHYPTDLIAGVLLGAGVASLSGTTAAREAAAATLKYLDRYPALLYALLYAWTFEVGEMFDSLRHIAVLAAKSMMRFSAAQVEAVGIPLLVALVALLCWVRRQETKGTILVEPEDSGPILD